MEESFSYAGFWKRLLAHFLDKLILGFAFSLIFIPLWILGLLGFLLSDETKTYERFTSVAYQHNWNNEFSIAMFSAFLFLILIVILISIILEWLYFALMESSSKQATFGKMIVGIIVTDMEGKRITFGKATGRYFGKFISGFVLSIGYLMAAFTAKKQALHDILSSCIVINKYNF